MKPFVASQFTPTAYTTAEDKAKFANHFARFVERDFPATMWKKGFYRRLSNCFHHIAHYDINGFASVWFADYSKRSGFIANAMQSSTPGDPAYTFSDVERVLQGWLKAGGYPEKYAALAKAERDKRELGALTQLAEKHGFTLSKGGA